VDCLNNRRLPEAIGNILPTEAEASFCTTLENEAMAAELTEISHR